MLSFIQHYASAEVGNREADISTDGKSAFVYTGGRKIQIPKGTTRLRVDKSAKNLDGRVDYGHLFSLELPPKTMKMDANLTQGTSCLGPSKVVQAMQYKISSYKALDVFKSDDMRSLRNVAFPNDLSDKDLPTFGTNSDLGKVLPAKRNPEYLYRMLCNGYALRNRFDGLPLHRICYYHSHESAEVAIRSLSSELGTQSSSISRASRGNIDCLGMTPLHILSCSTKHHLDMYQMIISRYPGHLIVQDVWGDIPLLYAMWGQAPQDVVAFLANSMKEYHNEYSIDWQSMTETLCIGLAPFDSIDYLIEANRRHFPTQSLRDLDWNGIVRVLCTKAKAPKDYVDQFITHYRDFIVDLEDIPLELARREKLGFKSWWLRIGISDRLSLLGKQKLSWQHEIESLISTCPTGASERTKKRRFQLMSLILRKLNFYETVAQMWVLELALWKSKLEESSSGSSENNQSHRSMCHYKSGANVVIQNVMEFLIENKRE